MELGAVALAIGTVLVVIVGIAVLSRQGHPERAADHSTSDDHDTGPVEEPYPPGSRPAGPGAEGMNPEEPGDITPGPEHQRPPHG